MKTPDAIFVYIFCCITIIFMLAFVYALLRAAKNGDRKTREAMDEYIKQKRKKPEEKDDEIIII